MSNATICEEVQTDVEKEEWMDAILRDITTNPKITNEELATKYNVHRNTISKYRCAIRERQLKTDYEITNKIDNILTERLPNMRTCDLIAYRKALTPDRLEVSQSEMRIIKVVFGESPLPKAVDSSES